MPKLIAKEEQRVKVGKHSLTLTHLDKVFWQEEGYTKGDLLAYYHSIAPFILPYLKNRPLSLKRHPNGIAGESFFHKDMKDMPPSWIKTKKIEHDGKWINYLVIDDEASMLYAVNLGCIEFNPFHCTIEDLTHPDYLVIDLDPEDISFKWVIEAAQTVYALLQEAKIPSYCKTSGGRGLHILVPLGKKYTYEQSKQFAELIALLGHQRMPKFSSIERRPVKRQRKVYLDYLQNHPGQTLAAVYCLRPRPHAPVSTPLEWDEVVEGLDPLQFNIKTIQERLKAKGDLFKEVLGPGADLENALGYFSEIQ